ncbi:uncharacterized protein BROUX77_004415 [Berkeleyomyces rouxiae]|uniref:uncharacterized protein n=1 Tax=Berkeleyomyces rouxiae TaxID=2035830 RepID=UPI003B82A0D2
MPLSDFSAAPATLHNHRPYPSSRPSSSSFLADASVEISILLANSQTLSSHDSIESLQDSDTSIINRKRQITGFQGSFSSNVGTREWPIRDIPSTMEAGGVKALVAKAEANARTRPERDSSGARQNMDFSLALPAVEHSSIALDEHRSLGVDDSTMTGSEKDSSEFDDKHHATILQVTPVASPRTHSNIGSTPPDRESKDVRAF